MGAKMVGGAGNAPVVAAGTYLMTPDV